MSIISLVKLKLRNNFDAGFHMVDNSVHVLFDVKIPKQPVHVMVSNKVKTCLLTEMTLLRHVES